MQKRVLFLTVLCMMLVIGCAKEDKVVETAETKETVVESETKTETQAETKVETKTETQAETKVETQAETAEVKKDYEGYMASVKEQSDAIKYSLENEPLNQSDLNLKSHELYELWDKALNDLWADIQNILTEDEYDQLLDEQLAWIDAKEKAVEEAGKEVQGGSMYPLVVNSEAAAITEKRVYELYELFK